MNIKVILFLLLIISCDTYSFSQSANGTKQARHRIFSQFGLVTYGSAGVKYQYILKDSDVKKIGIGLGFGMWYNLDLFGFVDTHYGRKYDISFQYLKGNGKNYFDFEFGAILNETLDAGKYKKDKLNKTIYPNFSYGYNLIPNLNIGYRMESKKYFVFRAGIGTPELIKISLGVKF